MIDIFSLSRYLQRKPTKIMNKLNTVSSLIFHLPLLLEETSSLPQQITFVNHFEEVQTILVHCGAFFQPTNSS